MDLEIKENTTDGDKNQHSRVNSPLRMKYHAEVELIRAKWGGLEDMRKSLGLSQRKMCQLLLVDPSAWTRWTRQQKNEDAPPQIYRSLSWYLLLLEKNPNLSPYVFLQTVARPQIPESEIKKVTGQISQDLQSRLDIHRYENLLLEVEFLKRTNYRQKAWLMALSFSFLGLFLTWVLSK